MAQSNDDNSTSRTPDEHSNGEGAFNHQYSSYGDSDTGESDPYEKRNRKTRIEVKCNLCDHHSGTQGGLNQHYKRVHSLEKHKYMCSRCRKGYLSQKDLRRHMTVHGSDSHPGPSSSTSTSKAAICVTEEVNDGLVLFHSTNYFGALDDLEETILKQSSLRAMLPTLESTKGFPDEDIVLRQGSRLSRTEDYAIIMEGMMTAISMLQTSGFCSENILVARLDPHRSKVITMIDVSIDDITTIYVLMATDDGGPHSDETLRKAADVLEQLGIVAKEPHLTIPLLCLVLALGLTSYAGSHCQDIGSLVWGAKSLDTIPIPAGRTLDDEPLYFCKRTLACLHEYIGGGIWVFGKKTTKLLPMNRLSISINQLTDLWGPIRAIPSPENLNSFENLVALQTEQGILFRSEDSPQSSFTNRIRTFIRPSSSHDLQNDGTTDGEVKMHYTRCTHVRRGAFYALGDCELPSKLTSFPSSSRLLIGMEGPSTSLMAGSSQTLQALPECRHSLLVGDAISTGRAKRPAEQSRESAHVLSRSSKVQKGNVLETVPLRSESLPSASKGDITTPDGFCVNGRCPLDLNVWVRNKISQLHFAGTHEPYYVPEELQIALNAGQYVNAGIQHVWKRRPGYNLKASLVRSLSSSMIRAEKVSRIMQLCVGFELSACTSNAQRVTLEDALALANPGCEAEIRSASQDGDVSYLLEFIVELSYSGLQNHTEDIMSFWPGRRKKLLLAWPTENDQTVFEWSCDATLLSQKLPQWTDMLNDDRDSACFAVLSPRCLTFTGLNEVGDMRIYSLCTSRSGKQPHDPAPVFRTQIALPSPVAEQRLRQLLMIGDGVLRTISLPPQNMLVTFRQPNRVERYLTRKTPRCTEIVNQKRLTSYREFVYIMDCQDRLPVYLLRR